MPTNVNCQYYHKGDCNHSSGRKWLGGHRACILGDFADERISACRFQMEHARPALASPPPPSGRPVTGGNQQGETVKWPPKRP